jgi:hypothetical protein
MARHNWLLIAPQFAWTTVRRKTSPALLKYDTSDLVNLFIKKPDGFLPLTVDDQVYRVVRRHGRFKFFNLDLAQTDTRKLYQNVHKRFYLVVFDVRCDALGFPRVNRDSICEAGFVIRRREWVFKLKKSAQLFESRLQHGMAGEQKMRSVAETLGGVERQQRWIPDPDRDNVGAWEHVTGEPNKPLETIYPVYPLIPDPSLPNHPAADRTIYFGLVPTSGTEMTETGVPRFDEYSLYDIRCFVRQHRVPCPKKPGRNDCSGPLFWSAATDAFQIAPVTDLIGTSYRPVNVQVPNLRVLKAQARIKDIGKRAPIRFNIPPKSGAEIGAPSLPIFGEPKLMGGLCIRNIPLTTIVAMVVYNIFKPIVVRILQLYHLEPLEFCIPSASASVPGAIPAMISPPGTLSPSLDPLPIGPGIDISLEELKKELGSTEWPPAAPAAPEELAAVPPPIEVPEPSKLPVEIRL